MPELSVLIIDSILALLLIAVIIVCLLVSRRLGTIKSGQAELRELVDQLNAAVGNAQTSVVSLKGSAEEIEAKLKLERQRASAIADELALMTEAGNNLADRIEKGLTGAGAAANETTAASDPSRKQQEEILAALKEAR